MEHEKKELDQQIKDWFNKLVKTKDGNMILVGILVGILIIALLPLVILLAIGLLIYIAVKKKK